MIRIEIPPLRERREDLLLLLAELNTRIASQLGRTPLTLADDALEALAVHEFPGNVRELENELRRLYALVDPDERSVGRERLSRRVLEAGDAGSGRYAESLRSFKVRTIERALLESGGRPAEAARRLGLHRSNLARMMRELGLRRGAGSSLP